MTVLGPIKPSELGITLTHEHCFVDTSVWFATAAYAGRLRFAGQCDAAAETVGKFSFAQEAVLGNEHDLRRSGGRDRRWCRADGRPLADELEQHRSLLGMRKPDEPLARTSRPAKRLITAWKRSAASADEVVQLTVWKPGVANAALGLARVAAR